MICVPYSFNCIIYDESQFLCHYLLYVAALLYVCITISMCVCVCYSIVFCACLYVQWSCSALKSKTRNKRDKRLKKSLKWLLQSVSDHWGILAPRVEAQNGVELRQKEREKRERIERRRRKREEEER